MLSPQTKIIDIGKKHIDDYIFDAIVSFNEGIDEIIIKGRGDFISKAVDVYRILKDKLGDSIELVNVEIGSERFRGRRRSYIAIRVRRKY